ncbi:hypothetical protein DP144_01885 [Clostridium tetani]|uniref:hypothetical protein n=1 Tax=Clostridium tetani TaxID=1513 RepID=UPI00100A7ACD|nr:hypothetical protein [Clostridium tetani]RXM79581.1 hypothetical protein DP154_01880 [Clostridium tetani]RYV00395.1 hypothetical protein DP144_01885 [Clostridium tetani]
MSFKVIDYITRKKAGMYALCNMFASNLENKAQQNANWKDRTSHARQALHSGVEGGINEYSIYLSHGVEYGEILEEGSKPHVITPKNGKALYWKGAAHPVKKVNHPGTKGFKTIENTLEGSREMIKTVVVKYWSDD